MTPDEDELLETLGADFDDVDLAIFDGGEPPPCPAPQDMEQANRYLGTLRHLDRRLKEIEAVAEAEVRRIAAWQDRRAGVLKRRQAWVERALAQWARAINEDDPAQRTFDLPNGEIAVRVARPKVEATKDQETLALIRKTHPEWVREKLEPAKVPMLKGVTPGPVAEEGAVKVEDGYVAHEAIVRTPQQEKDGEVGERIPGVFVLMPVTKAVTVTLGGER